MSVILPTYNERDNLESLIPAIAAAFARTSLEILVVDDGSPDGTAAAAQQLNARYGHIRVIERPARAGLGSAIRCGYQAARHDVLVSCDADGSFQPEDLVRLVHAVAAGADLALGVRHGAGAAYETPRWTTRVKYWISAAGNWFLRRITGLPIHDFSGNCRAIRRDIWQMIRTREQTNALLLEVILEVTRVRGRIVELPVTFSDRRHGDSKLNLWIEIPIYLLVAWRHLLRYWWRPVAPHVAGSRAQVP
ncbi:MAG: glycosyltransferase [Candidatus Omnitrophica bacterium]|nr:glycosyltransferase [Candidatus Omnitrophota bacterium]